MPIHGHDSDPVARRIRRFCNEVCKAAGETLLPIVELSPKERQALGGRIFYEGPLFVECVAKAMIDHPQYFASLGVDGAALLRAQDRAAAWRRAISTLRVLLQNANDAYLMEQGQAIQLAMTVLRQVDAEAALPLGPSEDAVWRWRILGGARQLIADRYQRLVAKARATRRQMKEQALALAPVVG